jgi:SAM-dependent methyltransferase
MPEGLNEDEQKKFDAIRVQKNKGMAICMSCGFVSYPDEYKSEEEIKEYYRKDYRSVPTYNNLVTGARKLNYHQKFLLEVFEEFKDKKPVVFEDGAAMGMALNFLRGKWPDGEFSGTELTPGFRKVAYYNFNLELDEDFDDTKKYDFIMTFKVAEHQLDVDKRLRKFAECLTDRGYLYISVPTWFGRLTNFGLNGFDLNYYYDIAHINVWTKKLFETVLKKAGLEIVGFDDKMYGETYLCKRNDDLMKDEPQYEDPQQILSYLGRVQRAVELTKQNKHKEAIELWPNYPGAWMGYWEMNRKQFTEGGQVKEFLFDMERAMGICFEGIMMAIDISSRMGDFSRALELIDLGLKEYRPNSYVFLDHCAKIYRQIAAHEDTPEQAKQDAIRKCIDLGRAMHDVELANRDQTMSWMFRDICD